MHRVQLNLLGGLEIRDSSNNCCDLPVKKAAALIGYLAIHPDRAQSREKLATLLWENSPTEQARASLRQVLSSVRRAIPAAELILDARSDWIALRADLVVTDVKEFDDAVLSGSTRDLTRAVNLYRGDLLDGINVQSIGFEAWLMAERQRLRTIAVGAMLKLLTQPLTSATVDAYVALALKTLVLDPAQEAVHRTLMRLFMQCGRLSDALRQYQRCREALARELDVEPDSETEELFQQLVCKRNPLLSHRPKYPPTDKLATRWQYPNNGLSAQLARE